MIKRLYAGGALFIFNRGDGLMGGSGLANPNEPQGSGGVFSAPYTLLNDHRNIIGIL